MSDNIQVNNNNNKIVSYIHSYNGENGLLPFFIKYPAKSPISETIQGSAIVLKLDFNLKLDFWTMKLQLTEN